MKNWLNKIFKKDIASNKGVSIQYVVIVMAIGIGLMVFGSFIPGNASKKQQAVRTAKKASTSQPTLDKNRSGPSSAIDYEHYYENQLRDALENVYGITGVIVKVYVSTSKEKIIGKNHSDSSQTTTEKDKQGGTRKSTQHTQKNDPVIVNGNGNGSNGNQPLVIGTMEPQISGVVVVAGGGDKAQVQLWVKQAVHSLLGVPEYRIAVLPKKQRGNEN